MYIFHISNILDEFPPPFFVCWKLNKVDSVATGYLTLHAALCSLDTWRYSGNCFLFASGLRNGNVLYCVIPVYYVKRRGGGGGGEN